VIATLICLLVGVLLLGVATRKQVFGRLVGPTIAAQYRFQKRLPKVVEYSETSFLAMARIGFIVLGAVLIVFGLISVAVLV
jgi:hypothetical protein